MSIVLDPKLLATIPDRKSVDTDWRPLGDGFIDTVMVKGCESPIEVLFLRAFLNLSGPVVVRITQQVRIGRWRVDFLVECRGRKLVVECDGHEFHEKTKGQVERDNERDRGVQMVECAIFRFAGSEIAADAEKCAKQVMAWCEAQCR